MDTVNLAALATTVAQTRTGSQVQLAVLKKAMDIQAQGAAQLIQAAAQATTNNPPHLGNRIDVRA
jgi:hypothetical protein